LKKNVVIGFYGNVKDRSVKGGERWERWRPTLSLFEHEDFLVDRFELLLNGPKDESAARLVGDIRSVSPETEIVERVIDLHDFWDFEEVYGGLHDFVKGYEWRTDQEDYLFHITTGSHATQICTFLLTESRHFPGRLLQSSPPQRRRGTYESRYHIVDLDLSRYDRLASRFHQEAADHVSFLKAGIETRNRKFNELMARLETVSGRTGDPILLTGPTGAGKSALARRIFELKQARNLIGGEYVEVNCATLRGSAALSTLFGHKKGAFTGAQQDREGLLRKADGGLVFLDEIGELGLDEQAMLLRAIEEKTFLPLGSDREVSSSFQLICGTNRDLQKDAGEGKFRRDLLARINLWEFAMPGLRDRREDIAPNLEYELDRYANRNGSRVDFNREAREAFLAFSVSDRAAWTGNFRDLNGAVTRMATLARSGRIKVKDVEEEVGRLRASWEAESPSGPMEIPADLAGRFELQQLDPFDRCQLAFVLDVCRRSDSLSDAGRKLYAVSREKKKTVNDADRVRKYLLRFGLDWGEVRPRNALYR
jgi:transcriptional regulatory protein RtcR